MRAGDNIGPTCWNLGAMQMGKKGVFILFLVAMTKCLARSNLKEGGFTLAHRSRGTNKPSWSEKEWWQELEGPGYITSTVFIVSWMQMSMITFNLGPSPMDSCCFPHTGKPNLENSSQLNHEVCFHHKPKSCQTDNPHWLSQVRAVSDKIKVSGQIGSRCSALRPPLNTLYKVPLSCSCTVS